MIGPIMDAGDLMADHQVQARRNVVRVPTRDGGALAMPDIIPRINGIVTEIRHAGPAIGADSDQVLARLGFSQHDVAALRRAKVIWT